MNEFFIVEEKGAHNHAMEPVGTPGSHAGLPKSKNEHNDDDDEHADGSDGEGDDETLDSKELTNNLNGSTVCSTPEERLEIEDKNWRRFDSIGLVLWYSGSLRLVSMWEIPFFILDFIFSCFLIS
uniref:FLYWCH-type domain-containing protein n=1 Tax=Heterorhabditis bacteriophora TaxID=37862 RepID=A0A1I7WSX5_HETBA